MAAGKLTNRKMLEVYGSGDGWLQVQVAKLELALGAMRDCKTVDWDSVKRLVFVCTGNLFRSPYAEHYARQLGLPVASFGVSTKSGMSPPAEGINRAAERGIDLADHKAIEAVDFRYRRGDLLVAMEPRQVRFLRSYPLSWDYPRTLLGLWATPRFFHLPDPWAADPAYLSACYARIEAAVDGLYARLPQFHPAEDPVRIAWLAAKDRQAQDKSALNALIAAKPCLSGQIFATVVDGEKRPRGRYRTR